MQAKYQLAEDKFKGDKEAGLNDFLSIVHDQASNTEDDIKVKEAAIYQIIDYFSSIKDVKRLCSLLKEIRPLLSHCPQAKTAKIIKSAFDALIKIPGSLDDGLEICKDIIQWCVDEKRSFLKLRMEIRLANLYYLKQLHKEALNLITNLKIDIKKIEDVMLHIDINLIETKIHIEVENIPRAKASLTAVKTSATAVNLNPYMQVEIDMLSGILATEERDYNTGYSYFYEAIQTYMKLNEEKNCVKAIVYMMLCKIMSNHNDEILAILHSPYGLKYQGRFTEAMKKIAEANKKKSLVEFDSYLREYADLISSDMLVKNKMHGLYDVLLEENIKKVVGSFSRVEIDHVAMLLGLNSTKILDKLSEMILDKKLNATLDQGHGCLILFGEEKIESSYETAIKIVGNLEGVADILYEKTKSLKSKPF